MMTEAVAAAETRSFKATPDEVAEIDAWIETATAGWPVAEDALFRARVCIAELAANVMEHGRAQADWDEITLTLRPASPAIEVEIADTGRPFDPTRPPAPVAIAGQVPDPLGGRGLRLLHAYASAMTYRRDGGRNILTLRVAPAARTPDRAD
jgi:anti-sigma regulatory factor (Ser/Thr protein kinase)